MTRAEPHAQRSSLAYLLGRLELVAARVRDVAESRRAVDPDPLDRFRGLHISPDQVDRLLSVPLVPLPPDAAGVARLAALEKSADEAEAAGADIRLRRLARAFSLDQFDVELLLIAMAPDLDDRFEKLYGYLHDDITRRRASIGLWLELCGLEPAGGLAWQRLAPDAPLVNGRLILVEEPERPFLTRSLRVPDRVTAFVLGGDRPDAQVAALIYPCEPSGASSRGLVHWLRQDLRLAYIREGHGRAAAPLAASALSELGGRALTVDLRRLRAEDDPALVAGLVSREATLSGSTVVAGPLEALAARGLLAIQAFSEMPNRVILVGAANWDPIWAHEVPFSCEAAVAEPAERARLWRASVDGAAAADLDAAAATAQFRLTPEQIRRAAQAAHLQARADGRMVEAADLRAGARAQNAAGLERLARRIEPAVGFADLVLPADVLDLLRELTIRARQRERVVGEWRMAGPASRRLGLTALFAGASGTGKSMAAEVVAGEMGLDLYVVDLASVIDKYIGETEKNLDRIFAEAEGVNGILLFDEADALFGKRSDISDAHDRYANVEVAYLLQRMELFEGIAILATNLRSNIDEAFARRLDVMVDFPEPEEADRLRLWDRCLGQLAPRGDDLDLPFLARAFKLSGGNIRNIVLTAAYTGAEENRSISMDHVMRATQGEYRKLGRLIVESEFGKYHVMVSGR